MRSFKKDRSGSLWHTLECNAKEFIIHFAQTREPLMVLKQRSDVIKDLVLEGPAGNN